MSQPPLRVLLVDDDPALLRRLSGWLAGAGYTVAAAVDAAEALAKIDAQVPDFLIADAEMPHLGGWELCRRVRDRPLSQYVYLVLLAAGPQQVQAADSPDGGADDVLCKPVAQGELLARLRSGRRVLELERRLCQAEGVDPLTGLMTRHAFHEVLAREWHRASRYGSPMACVMMDLDFFKRINDVYGHSAGDAVLRATAAVLLASCRRSDCVCRYGGEEFCILLPETDDRRAAAWAQRARRRLAAATIAVGGTEVRMTASFGTAQRHDDTAGPEQLVDMADQALLCAKQSGRDCTVRYESLTDAHELEPANPRSREALFRGIVARDVMSPLSVFLRESESIGRAADLLPPPPHQLRPGVGRRGAVGRRGFGKGPAGGHGLPGLLAGAGLQGDEAQRDLLRRGRPHPHHLRLPLPRLDPPRGDYQPGTPGGHHQPRHAHPLVPQPVGQPAAGRTLSRDDGTCG